MGYCNVFWKIEALPDLSNILRPSPVGNFAAYVFFSASGLFISSELGLLGGLLAREIQAAALLIFFLSLSLKSSWIS